MTFPVFGLQYEFYRLFAAGVSFLAILGFFLFLHKTRFGTWMRAVRQDREMAIAMGVPADRIFVVTFALGTSLAMLGGVVAAPITSVEFRLGLDVLPICFIAVIIGGLGNLPGTAAAAVLLALLEGIMTAYRRTDVGTHRFANADECSVACAAAGNFRESQSMTVMTNARQNRVLE